MLFHVTHKHSYQTCHAHDDERKKMIHYSLLKGLVLRFMEYM